jgi:hypothetical protein
MIKNYITKNCTFYKPKNKEKYKGKYPLICRSSWEYQFCQWLDSNLGIEFWSSEPIEIPYFNPITQKSARYYPDYLVKGTSRKGESIVWLVEVKPFKETHPPNQHGNKKKSTILYEQKTWKVNEAKFLAAKEFCRLKGWTFKIITERELFGNK